MSKARIYARNIAANWIGYGANLVVMFFLSPFVVHSLGNATYGVWSLLVSLTGYLGLVEMGTRAGLGRFINFHLGREDIPKVNGVINTALAFFLLCGIPLFTVAGGFGAFFGSLFTRVPPDLVGSARLAIILIALNLWLSFFSASFTQILMACERFDLTNLVDIGVLIIRTAGTVAVLWNGGGIIGLAAVQVASSLVGALTVFILAGRIFPQLRLRPSLVSKARFRELFGFSIWAFIGSIANQIVHYTDIALIGLLIGFEEVTFYAIGFMLLEYGRNIAANITRVITPDIQKMGGVADTASIRWIVTKGSRVTMFVAVPLLVGFLTFGREFITLWMGPQYVRSSWILFILTLPTFGALANSTCGAAVLALGHVKRWACMAAVEAILNLFLSIVFVLVMGWGIYGVALGTLVPMFLVNNLWLFVYTCKILRTDLWRFSQETVIRWALGAVLLIGIAVVILCVIPLTGWLGFWVKVLVLVLAYVPIGLFVVLSKSDLPRSLFRLDFLRTRGKPSFERKEHL